MATTSELLEFVTIEDIEQAPEDPTAAFIELVSKAKQRLSVRLQDAVHDTDGEWELRYEFMTTVISLAKELRIEPFASYEFPIGDALEPKVFDEFQSELGRHFIRLQWSNRSARRRDSVLLSPSVKGKIRTYVVAIREQIDKSDIEESRRSKLLGKLREFEEELEKERVSLAAVARIAFALLTAPGAVWASYEVVGKLTTMIIQTVGEAKNAEDERPRLPAKQMPVALAPPRTVVPGRDNDKPE